MTNKCFGSTEICVLSAKSLVVSSLSTDFHRYNENMRNTINFSEYLIKHLLEIEEISQNRQKKK